MTLDAHLLQDLTLAAVNAALESITLKANLTNDPVMQDMILTCAMACIAARYDLFISNTQFEQMRVIANVFYMQNFDMEQRKLNELKKKGHSI